MKQYPSIRVADLDFSKNYYVFDKIDGSNVRVEWSKKAGFHKFGTRKVLLSENSIIAPAKDLVLAIGPELEKGMKELRVQQATFFFEFAGDESIAGQHRLMNDNKRVWLLDVDIYKQGMLDPKECLKHFEPLMPKLLHHGTVDQNFLDSVADRTLPGMTWGRRRRQGLRRQAETTSDVEVQVEGLEGFRPRDVRRQLRCSLKMKSLRSGRRTTATSFLNTCPEEA